MRLTGPQPVDDQASLLHKALRALAKLNPQVPCRRRVWGQLSTAVANGSSGRDAHHRLVADLSAQAVAAATIVAPRVGETGSQAGEGAERVEVAA